MRRVSSAAMKCWELRVVDLYLCKLDALSNIRSAECLSCIAGITVQESMQQGHVFIFEARKCRHFGHELYIRYNKLYIYICTYSQFILNYIYIQYMYLVCMMLRKRHWYTSQHTRNGLVLTISHHVANVSTLLEELCSRESMSLTPGCQGAPEKSPRLGRGLDVDFSSEKTGPQKWKDSLKFPGSRLRRVARMPMPSSVLHCRPTMVGRLGEQKLGCRTQMVCLAFKNAQHFVASRACHFDPYS